MSEKVSIAPKKPFVTPGIIVTFRICSSVDLEPEKGVKRGIS